MRKICKQADHLNKAPSVSYPLPLAAGIIFLLYLELREQCIFSSNVKILNTSFNILITIDAVWASFNFVQYNLQKATFEFLTRKN